jgi:two-component system sensor histidine kinase HydH
MMKTDDPDTDDSGHRREIAPSAPSFAPVEPDRIRQCERLFGLGVLTTGLIHELNNPLNAILMNAELGLLRLQKSVDPAELVGILQKIGQEAKRGGALTRGVAEFAKADHYAPNGSADLNGLVEEARKLAQVVLRRNAVQLNREPDPELPELALNSTALVQALAHLFHNAAEAGASRIRVITQSQEGKVTVSVLDNGAGIRSEHLPLIFTPFFTTRQAQGKIGLGLSLARRIVADHGGTIEAHSVPGDTRLVISLPI